jgi:hypothetical protein
MLLGIATGRGQSVRNDLVRCIPGFLHRQVWIGYYNGGVVAPLWDASSPVQVEVVDSSLVEAAVALESTPGLLASLKLTKRTPQITIETKQAWSQGVLWGMVTEALSKHCARPPRVVASSHSVDILAHGVSKCAVVDVIKTRLADTQAQDVLCIGDRGCWPGNDFELLAQPFSLSVDEISSEFDSCWNLASAGNIGSKALLEYLGWLETGEMGVRLHIPMEG